MRVQCTDKISIDNDHWDLHGRKFIVVSAIYKPDTTAVRLVMEEEITGEVYCCTVASNQIVRE